MLRLALLFLLISLVAGLLGFTGISIAAAGVARILFFIAIVIFLVLDGTATPREARSSRNRE